MVTTAPSLDYIAQPLQGLALPIASLALDPANARTHDEKNLAAIKGSLARELLDRVEGRVQDRAAPGEAPLRPLVFNLVEATPPPDHSPPALPGDEGRVNARPVPPR